MARHLGTFDPPAEHEPLLALNSHPTRQSERATEASANRSNLFLPHSIINADNFYSALQPENAGIEYL
jgi:hypothetical protein